MKNDRNLENLYDSLAYVMWQVIKTDGEVSEKEREKFFDYFRNEFSLSDRKIDRLLASAAADGKDLQTHLENLKEALADKLSAKARFMQYLNECVYGDGIADGEYEVFEVIRRELF